MFTLCVFLLIGEAIAIGQDSALNEAEIRNRLQLHNSEASIKWNILRNAEWNCSTDIGNDEKEAERLRRFIEVAQFERDKWITTWRNATISSYSDETIRRQLFQLQQIGISALEPVDLTKLVRVTTTMTTIYNAAKICPYDQQNCNVDTHGLAIDPDVSSRMAHSRDSGELAYLWGAWHDATGKQMRSHYNEYVTFMNKAATANGLIDATKMWQVKYDYANFTNNINQLWQEVQPLYQEIHTYIKYKLKYIYDKEIEINSEYIPAHLLGNMWAQNWQNLFHDVKPFKNATLIDVTEKMRALKYTPLQMFETANEFITSLGLMSAKVSYMPPAIIEKPSDRLIECHPSAWDFVNGKDFRIKMCTNVTMEDLVTIHHELGHIQYFMQYKELPLPLRNGANLGFHEAIGETIALSASTPQHLMKIGLLDGYKDSPEDNINALLYEALDRVASLPYGLLIDKWRWDIFSGNIKQSEWNKHWWDLRETLQRITKPIQRSEHDFDAGANFHVPAGAQYLSYFIANILQFQLYKSLCIEAKEYDPSNPDKMSLHKCDFYNSKEAGQKLADGLKLGASKHWTDILEVMTSETDLNTDGILEYFRPLREFLQQENRQLRFEWVTRGHLKSYNEQAGDECRKYQLAEWDFITDVNNRTKHALRSQALLHYSKFKKDAYDLFFSKLNPDEFADESLRRQIMIVTKLGTGHLNGTRLQELSLLKSKMESTYSMVTFCPYSKRDCNLQTEALTLEPEITHVMATSTNYDELKYTWTQWFDRAGAPMREDFKQYVEIVNEAAKLNGMDDYGELWRSYFEDPNFIDNVKTIWNEVEPLYSRLHEYTRFKLLKMYGNEMNEDDPLIPAHLLGNMWAQSWVNLYDRIKPFKHATDFNITKQLKTREYTALRMFQESDRFYQSLDLEPMEMSYTNLSIIEKPTDRVIVCHASAWDFCNGHDFRIKQCTTVDHKNFITIHHEMGHIQYYILYKDQPVIFRTGANPGFHEAIGDLMALSAATPTHLEKINLLDHYNDTAEEDMNALFKMALERVAFLPFGLLIDMYRWDIFSGNVPESKLNGHWEHLREKYQKVRSPENRTEEHFDAGAKFHVPADYPYISYFIAHILEFQLHRSMCLLAEQYDPEDLTKPLHKCDIAGSYKVGKRLRDGLSLGASKHWSETLKILTNGETKLSADAILEYFEPLDRFLLHENYKTRQLNTSYQHIPIVIGATICGLFVILILAYFIYLANRGPNPRE